MMVEGTGQSHIKKSFKKKLGFNPAGAWVATHMIPCNPHPDLPGKLQLLHLGDEKNRDILWSIVFK